MVNVCCFVCTFRRYLLEIHWELWCELLGEDGSSMDWVSSLVQAWFPWNGRAEPLMIG